MERTPITRCVPSSFQIAVTGPSIVYYMSTVDASASHSQFLSLQVYYYVVDSPRNLGKDFFEINMQTGEVFTRVVFDREKQGAYALEVEARDGAPSARPNSHGQPNSGEWSLEVIISRQTIWLITGWVQYKVPSNRVNLTS